MSKVMICNDIKEILAITLKEKEFDFDLKTIEDDVDIVNELGINSIIAIEIIVRLENQFDIEIDDDDLSVEIMRTVSKLADFVQELISNQTLSA